MSAVAGYGAVERLPAMQGAGSVRRLATVVAATAGSCLVIIAAAALLSQSSERPIETALVGLDGGRRTQLEYFADMGYTNAQYCDGSQSWSQQSPIAIDTGVMGMSNVVEEHLPPFGWVGMQGSGLFRFKTPGTQPDTGEPGVKLFVHGNKFDMSEVHIETMYGGNHYKLDHFVLKTPAEHTINGETFAMEQQLVHLPVGDDNPFNALIVSVLFKENPLNSPSYVEKIYHAIACMGEGKHCQGGWSFAEMARTILYETEGAAKWGRITYDFHPMDVCKIPPCVFGGSVGDASIPAWVSPHERANFRSYFKYQGSFPTPPCQEGVQWIVLNNPLPIATPHLDALQLIMGDIARPVQPLNGRIVQEAVSRWW
eukprot:CAMPEP_0181309040 /NCGR_PEP_ID=MMETSP1101-20121128/11801_1 /TAXON_ID=46948 /ORGANISM="Rhodomonas abbreviata, Strain Caron Lab Isolate" /LENGTH=369 /DNA_ID=CAMNT_0023415497 /DNA_START=100 /DNA_END=1206 /DNA_ORIENTATION=-